MRIKFAAPIETQEFTKKRKVTQEIIDNQWFFVILTREPSNIKSLI